MEITSVATPGLLLSSTSPFKNPEQPCGKANITPSILWMSTAKRYISVFYTHPAHPKRYIPKSDGRVDSPKSLSTKRLGVAEIWNSDLPSCPNALATLDPPGRGHNARYRCTSVEGCGRGGKAVVVGLPLRGPGSSDYAEVC